MENGRRGVVIVFAVEQQKRKKRKELNEKELKRIRTE
jgi:hypothetical protein